MTTALAGLNLYTFKTFRKNTLCNCMIRFATHFCTICTALHRRAVASEGIGGGMGGRTVNSISTRGQIMPTTVLRVPLPPGFSYLATALHRFALHCNRYYSKLQLQVQHQNQINFCFQNAQLIFLPITDINLGLVYIL